MAGGRNRSQYVASACSTTVHPVHEIKYQCTLPHAQCLPIVLNTCDHPRSGICSDSFFLFFSTCMEYSTHSNVVNRLYAEL